MNGHLEGEPQYLGDLLTRVINHLLTGMILQVVKNDPPMKCVSGKKSCCNVLLVQNSSGFSRNFQAIRHFCLICGGKNPMLISGNIGWMFYAAQDHFSCTFPGNDSWLLKFESKKTDHFFSIFLVPMRFKQSFFFACFSVVGCCLNPA